ncbi:MAG: isoprenylcysteine carboxylmethyltransferase family protein [Acidimicrobiia bacterium]
MPENFSRYDSDQENRRGAWWVVLQGALFVLFIMALVWGNRLDGGGVLVYVRAAGLLVAGFGAGVSAWSVIQHGARLSPFPRPVSNARLIEGGPYRFVRHPMYSGIIAFTLGTGVAYASPATVLTAPMFFVFFVAKTAREEEMLVALVPGYRRYRSEVPWRLIPRIV